MGGGASSPAPKIHDTVTDGTETTMMKGDSTDSPDGKVGMFTERKNRGIFEKSSTVTNLKREFSAVLLEKMGEEPCIMDTETEKMIKECLDVFFLGEDLSSKLNIVMRTMKKEVIEVGEDIVREGEPGNKLYIISEGSAEVRIKSEFIRTLHPGAIFGELALLYDAPRSATVTCLETCVLWSLEREIFKYTQAFSASAEITQRTKWLTQSPGLAKLTPFALSKLVASMPLVTFKSGEALMKSGDFCAKVILVEKGSASVYVPVDTPQFLDDDECDEKLQIVRPHHRLRISIMNMDIKQISQFIRGQEVKDIKNSQILQESPTIGNSEVIIGDGDVRMRKVCTVYEGCILGMGSLMPTEDSLWGKTQNNDSTDALCPFTVIADDNLEGTTFGVEMFKRTIGSLESILQGDHSYRSMNSVINHTDDKFSLRNIELESSMFTPLHVLGSGCFGITIEADYINTQSDEALTGRKQETYALKYLDKSKAVSNFRQILKERDLLSECNSAFVMYYHGCFQTENELVIVSEVIDGPDLYTIIYESQFHSTGIPFHIARFFAAGILFGLSHIHDRGIAFRDLKPENVMIDSSGYIRIIDFGFASKVPYIKVDPVTGESTVHAKLYTLCGTPEYFAPELLFNLGHDQSADLWSYAVMVHELLLGFTTFCGADTNDITQLFRNIALVQRRGLQLSPQMDIIEYSDESKSLLKSLLRSDPAERLGVQQGSTNYIFEHAFFRDLDLEKMFTRDLPAPYIPSVINPTDRKQLSSLKRNKPFTGDQTVFSEF